MKLKQSIPVINASNYYSSLRQSSSKKSTPCLVTKFKPSSSINIETQDYGSFFSFRIKNTNPIIHAPPVMKATTRQGLLLSFGMYRSNLYSLVIITFNHVQGTYLHVLSDWGLPCCYYLFLGCSPQTILLRTWLEKKQ